jgi:hypothetical protein
MITDNVSLDLTRNTPLEMDIVNIGALPAEEFTLARRDGIGASESSVVLGVNPFKSRQELLEEKLRTHITAEERAIALNPAVIKGNDLEPIIVDKFQALTGWKTIKPSDQYRMKDFPFMKINFDGVIDMPEVFGNQYIPVEIKVVTMKGERHYNPTKAFMNDKQGVVRTIPDDPVSQTLSYLSLAQGIGIPVYYYTQLQMQMLGLNAPFGYLASFQERDWTMYGYFVQRNERLINELIVEAYKFWDHVTLEKQRRGLS